VNEFETLLEEQKKKQLFWRRLRWFFGLFLVSLCGFVSYYILVPPRSFPAGTIFEIPDGATFQQAAQMLEEKGVIRSSFALRVYIALVKYNHPIISGFYLLPEKESLSMIAERIVVGEYRIERVKILIPEGFDIWSLEKALTSAMPAFDGEKFLSIAKKDEGYLFPDTYFFFTIVRPEEVVAKMRGNFNEKTKDIAGKIKASGHPLADIVTMASIIERETVTPADRRIVSGILWKRIKLGMPLQVDAAFNYVNGKSTYDLTLGDLQIDSRYNTYKYKGLPPGPIANPGLDTILAALEPTETQYLYYLSGKDGTMYYAKNFEEHKRNKVKYLTR
jgi:UPF0755 protein